MAENWKQAIVAHFDAISGIRGIKGYNNLLIEERFSYIRILSCEYLGYFLDKV